MLRRLLVLACVLGALLAPTVAWAHAPMCDEHAQTVEAPLPIYPSRDGEIAAAPNCDDDKSRLDAAPERGPERPLLSAESIDRGLALVTDVPACAKSARLALSSIELGRPSAGAGTDVFRPPRS